MRTINNSFLYSSFIYVLILSTFNDFALADRVITTKNVETNVRIRESPDIDLTPIVGRLKPGESTLYIGETGEWYKVMTDIGETGYVSKEWTRTVPDIMSCLEDICLGSLDKDNIENIRALIQQGNRLSILEEKVDKLIGNKPPKSQKSFYDELTNNKSLIFELATILVTIILSAYVLARRLKKQTELKIIDLTNSLQDRYDDIMYNPPVDIKNDYAEQHFRRLGDLYHAQFEYWKLGYINEDIYLGWMENARYMFKKPRDIKFYDTELTYEKGWDNNLKRWRTLTNGEEFVNFMRDILFPKKDKKDVKQILDDYKQRKKFIWENN